MNTVHEIERAISALTSQQLAELYAWLDQHDPQPIDARLQTTLKQDASTTPFPVRLMMKSTGAPNRFNIAC